MQANELTISVNVDNDDGTTALVDKLFTRFDEFQNRSEYIAATHTLGMRDKLGLYRTFPKESGNFKGVAKSAIKVTRDYEVPGKDSTTTVVAPSIVNVEYNNPVGMTPAQTLEMRMTAIAIQLDDVIMIALNDQLMV